LDILRDRPEGIDLVVLDLSMPGKSGVEVFHDIRDLNCRVPIAISSGYSEEEVIKRFGSNAISGFVQKPFTSSRLVEDISNLLKPRTASGSAA
jgi:DNA-binding NarL/FixJ family response regulator